MTRNEAAAYLGVAAQTITNWVNKGLLEGVNDKKSKRFFLLMAMMSRSMQRNTRYCRCLKNFWMTLLIR